MLILSRKVNQSIVIDNQINISVVEIRHDHVRIGIDAPRALKVYRQELYEAIQQENLAAAQSTKSLSQLPNVSSNSEE